MFFGFASYRPQHIVGFSTRFFFRAKPPACLNDDPVMHYNVVHENRGL